MVGVGEGAWALLSLTGGEGVGFLQKFFLFATRNTPYFAQRSSTWRTRKLRFDHPIDQSIVPSPTGCGAMRRDLIHLPDLFSHALIIISKRDTHAYTTQAFYLISSEPSPRYPIDGDGARQRQCFLRHRWEHGTAFLEGCILETRPERQCFALLPRSASRGI